jgi:elongation factor P
VRAHWPGSVTGQLADIVSNRHCFEVATWCGRDLTWHQPHKEARHQQGLTNCLCLPEAASRAKGAPFRFPVGIHQRHILEYEKGIWKVAKTQHTQPGKGGAFMQVEMKNLIDGRKTNVRFRSQDTIERVRLDTKDFQFLYVEGDNLVFMDQENYEQITLPSDLIGDAAAFLSDGMEVTLEMYDERPISVALPEQVEATIVEADAVVKGQTASSSFKPAILDNGVRVMVPPHIGAGTRIIVDVYERTYVGKVN